jgi:hypothetical protein
MEVSALDYIGVIMLEEDGMEYDQIRRRVEGIEGGIVCTDILGKWEEYKRMYCEIGNNVMEAKLFENFGICEIGSAIESNIFSAIIMRTCGIILKVSHLRR